MDEQRYDEIRAGQWLAGTAVGRGFSRRDLLRTAGLGAAVVGLSAAGVRPAAAAGPIVKPLPPELFTSLGTNAEMKWEAMRGVGSTPRSTGSSCATTPARRSWTGPAGGCGCTAPGCAAARSS